MIRLLTFLYQDRDALEGMNPFPTSSDQSKLRIRMAVLSLLFHGLIGTAAPSYPSWLCAVWLASKFWCGVGALVHMKRWWINGK